ncbi:hypothetical protein FOB58_001330 [Candida parapsilosis]|uniref:Subtelomeric hrmA-associated cluster protein AFUB-079030/YDR124W-like helical bundle domain-containing protein n=2 Tax=Candida parapsilosis TaxID=5480 RepID=G8BEY1_CANPC|nr:uncharacterized protein CPAR2_200820 [Candida parapsilosis]KAF6055408.1 hypothetical protein FOB58_001330 [Candida parapsilosis]KAF6055569.1 hypothetical protein FOB59_000081 [Candida parapsilosis]KAF6058499.1 hypothetical protein FOB60_000081 [Candida parapsilosis]KAF6067256.1 hypothetical protein FOB61_000081 [Candida parapsilosis]KAI5903884.1 hypothetical protein K4G60_g3041 [Candida parapsilosis]
MSQIQSLTSVINQLHKISGNSSYKYMLVTQDDSHPNTELTFHYSSHFNSGQIEDLKLLLGRSSLTTIKPTLINSFPLTLTKNQSPQQLLNQYRDLFNSLSQYVCKDVAKAWIKILEPNKQALFPYRDYNKSKPDWWPPFVNHIEPDHLDKVGRVEVLINVLRHPRFDLRRVDLKQYQEKPVLYSLLKEILYLAMYERMFFNLLRHQDELFYLIPQHEQKLFDLDRIQIMTSWVKHPFKKDEVIMASKIVPREMNTRIYGLNETNEMDEEEERDVGDEKETIGCGNRKTLVVKLRHRRGGKVEKLSLGRKQTRATFKREIAKRENSTKKSKKQVSDRHGDGDISSRNAFETKLDAIVGSEGPRNIDCLEDDEEDAKMEDFNTVPVKREDKNMNVEHSEIDLAERMEVEQNMILKKDPVTKQFTEEPKLGSPFSYNSEETADENVGDATDEEYVDSGEEESEVEPQSISTQFGYCNARADSTIMLKTPEIESSSKFDTDRNNSNKNRIRNYQYPITPASSSNNIQGLAATPMARINHMDTRNHHQQVEDDDDVYVVITTPTIDTHVAHFSTPCNNIITHVNCPPPPHHPTYNNINNDHIKQDFLDFHQSSCLSNDCDEYGNNVMGIMNQIGSTTDGCEGCGSGCGPCDACGAYGGCDFESDLTDYVSDHSSCAGSFADKSDDTDYEVTDRYDSKNSE